MADTSRNPFQLRLTLAQEGDPFALPGEATGGAGTAAPGGTGNGAGGAVDPFGGSQVFLIVFLLLAGMIVFSIFGQRRERKRRETMLSSLKKHDKVQTLGGVLGSIVEVKKDQVVLKVDEASNTRITFARSAIQQVHGATVAAGDGQLGTEKS